MNKIKIAYIQEADPSDKNSSSGVPYKMYEQLVKHNFDVEWIPVQYGKLFKLYGLYSRVKSKLIKKYIDYYHTKFGASLISSTVTKHSKIINNCDIIYAPLGSSALFKLKTAKPVIYESDATWNNLIDYYIFNISAKCKKQGDFVEHAAMNKAAKVIFASEWAAESAKNYYQQDKEKVHVLEYGANMDITKTRNEYSITEPLDILFLGVDWKRKGGEIAITTVKKLNESGIKAVIHIVGIKEQNFPKEYLGSNFVDYVGFLNKNKPDEYSKIQKLLCSCHLLLLPTVAECAGIAFCEASAYGLPIFTHLTGGIANYVKNGINGYTLPLGSTGEDFANKIMECLKSGELEKLHNGALTLSKDLLNWDQWGNKFESIINDCLTKES